MNRTTAAGKMKDLWWIISNKQDKAQKEGLFNYCDELIDLGNFVNDAINKEEEE